MGCQFDKPEKTIEYYDRSMCRVLNIHEERGNQYIGVNLISELVGLPLSRTRQLTS